MKLLLYTDPHLSTNSSIIVGKMEGQSNPRYSARLSACIDTFKWINDMAKALNVDKIFCLGDLTDQSKLTAEELSAISESGIDKHEILVGNHDVSTVDGYFNSCNIYGNAIREFRMDQFPDGTTIAFLPWSRKLIDLDEIGKIAPDKDKLLILSHNDIKGIRYGGYVNQTGYDLNDIVRNCRMFINGHLHVGQWLVEGKVMNLGTVLGVNFNNTATWGYYALFVDTDTWNISPIPNPHAFHFYDERIVSRTQMIDFFNRLRSSDHANNVVQVRVPKSLVESIRDLLNNLESVKFSRILTLSEKITPEEGEEESNDAPLEKIEISSLSVYDSLREFCKAKCPTNKYDLDSVLSEINNLEGAQ